MKCADCDSELERDERALSYKLMGRASRECCCLKCLGKRFQLSQAQLRELIVRFRESGCTLFR